MSFPTGYQELRADQGEKIVNKTQIQFPQSGDDNANQLPLVVDQKGRGRIEDRRYSPSSIPPLVSQSDSSDKLVIWGSEQQCMEPDLREFELLECQEIHTFLGNRDQDNENEEEDDGGSMKDGKDEGPMSISSSSTASSASTGVRRNDNDSNKVEDRLHDGEVRKRIVCHSTEELDACVTGLVEKKDTRSGRAGDRERRKGGLKESKSETNVFVSSLSAVSLSGSLSSALDTGREIPSFISLSNTKTNPYTNTNSTTSAQTRRRAAPGDANQISPPPHPQEKRGHPQNICQDQRQEGSHQKNGLSSDGVLGQRRKAGFEERVMPPRRQQLVRPLCQTEMGRGRSFAESNAQQPETRQPSSANTSSDSHGNGQNRKFIKSSLREPSDFSALYNTPAVSQLRQPHQATQRETPPGEKQPGTATWRSSNPSALEKRPQTQLTYRRNCSSPNRTGIDSRSSTPPHSPLRTPQGSPRRQPSMYLVSRNVSGVAAVTTSAQGNGNSCMRAPVKTSISTSGIPKAPLNNHQSSSHNPSPKDSSPSPKLKPKGVRPKIITYVRKNPQFKPQASDGPYQVSSLPSRLSTYAHGQTATSFKENPKDPSKPNAESRGAPVLSASNLLYDKYRQEMQTSNIFAAGMLSRGIRPPGHTHTVPPAHTHSHTAPPKLGSKADNFYGAPTEVSTVQSQV